MWRSRYVLLTGTAPLEGSDRELVVGRRPTWRLAPALLKAVLLSFGLLLIGASVIACWRWHGLAAVSFSSGAGVLERFAPSSTSGFCGLMEDGVEYHSRDRLSATKAASAAQCCALCDGQPLCGAWNWGKQRGMDGLTDVCSLFVLASGEQVMEVRRPGVISGLPTASVTKHGLVAGMVSEERRREGRGGPARRRDRAIRKNETCPGKVHVAGFGHAAVVAALWSTPDRRATQVDLLPGLQALSTRLHSRAFLADRCEPDAQGDFVALKLLGKTLRYTVDLSGAGCGCDASLHLIPMRQNMEKSMCEDFTCGAAGGACMGAACAELAVQEASQYAWATAARVRDDARGVSVGYAAREHEWTAADYGPGGRCVDTSWPFEVAVSFPVSGQGLLEAVEVRLTQAGQPCPLAARIGHYHFKGRDGLLELSSALESGVAPVLGYRSSRQLARLDGLGEEGWGPCVRESVEACGASVRFYGLAIEDLPATRPPPRTPPSAQSPLGAALSGVHLDQRRRADVIKRAELSTAISVRLAEEARAGGTAKDGARTVAQASSTFDQNIEERSDGHTEWEVTFKLVKVRKTKSLSAEVLGTKQRGEVFVGHCGPDGWVSLSQEPGFIRVQLPEGLVLLRKRKVAYEKLPGGSCRQAGLFPIMDVSACRSAGFSLGYYDPTVSVDAETAQGPEGCYLLNGQLRLSMRPRSNGAARGEPLCSSGSYATTTITTTTTRTTVTTTVTTHSTTRTWTTTMNYWGFPSLFCFMVMMTTNYELGLVKEQIRVGAGIFGCDEHAVFSQDPVTHLGTLPSKGVGNAGNTVTTVWFKKAAVGLSRDHTAANALLFMHVWQAVQADGHYKNHHWTIKADPDAVVLPWRLRRHLRPHTGPATYLVNCNKYPHTKNFPMIYGAVEAYSRKAMEAYFKGALRCKLLLKWHEWGEDFFMGRCMKFLKVRPFDDFGLVGDERCLGADCGDGSSAAYHDFKNVRSWLSCWRNATRAKDRELLQPTYT